MKIIALIIYFTSLLLSSKAQFSFNIEFARPVTEKVIYLKATVTNISNKPIKVADPRRITIIRETIVIVGSYIINVQKYNGESYQQFIPSDNIIRSTKRLGVITIPLGKSITDTLQIYSSLFLADKFSGNRFPPGQYRIRAAFNSNGLYAKKAEFTKWLEFIIQ